ncbi:Zn-dependent amino-or carboxypeptidase, M28 family [Fodinibius roseus]|uniref:Zn-dependent amino-or carboxypeptidase, M28 family n=2 Tax=Fodinibius roseus TaxID=1194090 RepID=A0A1M5FQT8_9BACT|nr:Zn-dependent amino-or carboxypeptidase, M28 family [Fodinibius roseus]
MELQFTSMRRIILLAAAGFFWAVSGCSSTEQSVRKETQPSIATNTERLLAYQDEITTDFLRQHLTVFASDSMEGRETAMPGQKKAARYLANQYREMNMQPAGESRSYFQKFKLTATQRDSIVFKIFAMNEDQKQPASRSVSSRNATGDFIRAFGGTDSLSGQIVFAGFGVNDPSRGLHHLKGMDLQGKWVMVFQDIPHIIDGDTLVDPSIGARARFSSIFSQGAEGMLLISDMAGEEFRSSAAQKQSDFGKPTNMRLAYRDDSVPSQEFSNGYNVVSPTMATRLLRLENPASLTGLREKIIQNITDFTPRPLDYGLSQIPYEREVSLETKNVLAYLEGADPQLKDEVVVVTSHYDHVGIGQPDSTGDRIYNGADDDGSGTVAMLNMAHAFREAARNGVSPRRSILFLNVTGEEKGLLGSRYYSDHPVFPIEKTVANLNMDMIGRIDEEHQQKGVENYAYIIGSELISSELDSLIKAANRRSGQITLNKKYNDLKDPNQFYRRSDHWNFGRLGVPFAFFFTGVHEDYHRPSDEVHKIRFEKMAGIVRTIYASAVMIANADEAPSVDNQEFIEITKTDL